MRRLEQNLLLRWAAALPVLTLAACGPSAEERQQAEQERRHTELLAYVQQGMERNLRQAGQRCRERTAGLRTLVTQYPDLTVQMNGATEPNLEFALALAGASAQHDSSKSCARLVDSVAKVVRMERTSGGSR